MHLNFEFDMEQALEKLGSDFPRLNWDFSPNHGSTELLSHWPGEAEEDVMVNVFKGKRINEQFHRQDFFFIHFAYRGDYQALSAKFNNRITMQEGNCYIGQPYSGYAAKREVEEECIIIGVLIRQKTFIREFLTLLSADTPMLQFFLEPQKNRFAEEFVHMNLPSDSPVWKVLMLLVLEYANKTEHTQKIIKPLAITLSMYLSAEYKRQNLPEKATRIDEIKDYIETNADNITLAGTASYFGYHPVYLSRMLSQKAGKTFGQLQLIARMRRAKLLLDHTDLSIEKITAMLGYSNSSNFYKAFRQYYGKSPRNKS